MEYQLASSATPEEVHGYRQWRDRYARDDGHCLDHEAGRRSLGKRLSAYFDERMVRRALEALPRGARVLDVPCGAGRISRALRRTGLRPVATDFSAWMLREASRQGRAATVQGDILQLPFATDAFAACVCIRFMQAAPGQHRIAALRELGRVSDLVVVNYPSVYSVRALRRFLFGGKPLTNRLSEAQVASEVEAAGLEVRGFHYKTRLLFEDFVVVATRVAQPLAVDASRAGPPFSSTLPSAAEESLPD